MAVTRVVKLFVRGIGSNRKIQRGQDVIRVRRNKVGANRKDKVVFRLIGRSTAQLRVQVVTDGKKKPFEDKEYVSEPGGPLKAVAVGANGSYDIYVYVLYPDGTAIGYDPAADGDDDDYGAATGPKMIVRKGS